MTKEKKEDFYLEEDRMINRIHLSFRDCIVCECESNELNFSELRKQVLELFQIIKKDATESDKEPYLNETV